MRSLAAEHADAQQAGDSQKRSSRALNKLGLSGTSFKGSRRATSEAHEAQAPHQNGSIAAVPSQDAGKPSLLGRLCCRCSVLQLCLPQLQRAGVVPFTCTILPQPPASRLLLLTAARPRDDTGLLPPTAL